MQEVRQVIDVFLNMNIGIRTDMATRSDSTEIPWGLLTKADDIMPYPVKMLLLLFPALKATR